MILMNHRIKESHQNSDCHGVKMEVLKNIIGARYGAMRNFCACAVAVFMPDFQIQPIVSATYVKMLDGERVKCSSPMNCRKPSKLIKLSSLKSDFRMQ